jgi:Domain of unknown function (DUF1707)/2TM domain
MDREPGDQRRASLRASDADREQFVEALRQHHADGRLTAEELAERTERAYGARYLRDLDALAADLPPLRPPPPAPGWDPSADDLPRRMRPPSPRRAAAKANLLRSVLWYGMLSLVLIVVWVASGRDYFWPVWPILGFVLLLGWQAIAVWSRASPYDDDPTRRRDRNP